MNNVAKEIKGIKEMADRIEAMLGSELQITSEMEREARLKINEVKIDRFIKKNEKDWKKVGKRYQAWRVKNELTKSYVAEKIGCASSTLSRWEQGEPCRIAKNIQAGYDLLKELQQLQAC